MFILCQKKDTIVNLKKVQAINIHLQNRKEVCAWFNVNENYKNSVLLGVYETEERAKEVLQEIIKAYKGNIFYMGIENKVVYEMPEK